jgi:hypothetical protein
LLLDRELLTRPLMKALFLIMLLTTVAGVAYAKNYNLPWSGMQFEGVGVFQQFKPAQWMSEANVRSFGFGGDEHSAASSIGTLFILLSIGLRRRAFYLCAAVALIGVYLTTSRTNLLCLLVYLALWSVSDMRRTAADQPFLSLSLWLSFCAILVPIFVIGVALYFSIDSVPPALLSLWIRGTDTWLAPFQLTDYLAPFALIHGFGLGGFGFGLLQSDLAQYFTTVDNFILFNYFAFGVPYIAFYFYQCRRMLMEHDPYKVIIYVVTAMYGVTLRGWSDYLFMILVGYTMTAVFGDPPMKIMTETLYGERSPAGLGRTRGAAQTAARPSTAPAKLNRDWLSARAIKVSALAVKS